MNDPGNGASRLVHVVDDEEAVRRSVEFLLRSAGYRVQSWSDGRAFLKHVDKRMRGCVLLDLHMPELDGAETQERMVAEGFDWPVIMLTGHGDIDLAVRAMKAGASDFLVKPCDREKLLGALAHGFSLMDRREIQCERSIWARAQLGKLTERERQVLEGLACGYPNKTIAFDLGISVRTVEVYRANVMTKLDVGNFADVLRVAFAAGLGSESVWRHARFEASAGASD